MRERIILILLVLHSLYTFGQGQTGTDVRELVRQRHKVNEMAYGHPYTTFDTRDKNYKNLDSTLANIRRTIKNGSAAGIDPVFLAYKRLYRIANSTMPTDNGLISEDGGDRSLLAKWAKHNAFVFLIGLDSIGNPLDTPGFTTARNRFRDNALEAFEHLTGTFDADPTRIVLYSPDDDKMQHYSRSITFWLQAYDMLKAAYEVSELRNAGRNPYGFADADRNIGNSSPRNKLRRLCRDLYIRSKGTLGMVEHAYGWKRNHGIACAGTLLMAAQVLNDAGVERNLISGFFSYLFTLGEEPWPYPNYSPINWNELGQTGLDENLFDGKHWWPADNVPQSPRNKVADSYSVYAEGPGYCEYGLIDNALPAMRAQCNLYPTWSNEVFLRKNEIKNIFNWYNRIRLDDNTILSYDNTRNYKKSTLALTGNPKFNTGSDDIIHELLEDYIAIVGGNNIALNTEKRMGTDYMPDAGNIVLRNKNGVGQHHFCMLFERDRALDGDPNSIYNTHEDDDMGSFLIYANDTGTGASAVPLAIDPPYYGWGKENGTNRYWMHNTIEIDDGNPADTRTYKNPQPSLIDDGRLSNIQQFNLSFDFKNDAQELFSGIINRNVNAINVDENFYYFINDFVDATDVHLSENSSLLYIKLNLNGNGNKDVLDVNSLPTFRKVTSGSDLYRWTYRCGINNLGWGLTAHVAAYRNSYTGWTFWEDPYTKDSYYHDGTKGAGIANETHTRIEIHQPVVKTIFQSFLYPQKCDWSLPIVTKKDSANYLATTIVFINAKDTSISVKFGKNLPPNPSKSINDTASHFHYTRWDGNVADSVSNPFNLPSHSTYKIKLDAQKAFVKRNTLAFNANGYKYCEPTYANIRYISINNGTYISYRDSDLIASTIPVDASIGFSKRYTYIGRIKALSTPSGTDSITLFLPDVGRGVDMVALQPNMDTIPSRYDSLTKVLHMQIPATATTFFVTEKQNCLNCYFPPTWMKIDSTFDMDEGHKETLGNKLTVQYPKGLLRISNSSKIDMCEGVYLQNKDSIIIEGPCQTKAYEHKTCNGVDSLVAPFSNNSAIIITPGSALVLEPGSHTYIKNGGGIYVRQNGSLIIKAGAFVQIGDSGTCSQGWGEIIAEPGAYVHIEPDAHIEYRKTAGDTLDRNMFLIPVTSPPGTAQEGVYFAVKTILQTDTILPDTNHAFFTYPICGLDTTTPFVNKAWGYTNFAKPFATFQSRNDTLCPGEPLHIKLNRMLNDARYQIKVCRMDSILNAHQIWVDTCITDTIVQDSILPDPICKEPRNAPDEWTYYFDPGTTHRVTISAWNDCGVLHDTVAYIYAAEAPSFTVSVPSTVCEGIGTFYASISDLNNQMVRYALEVTEKQDSIVLYSPSRTLMPTYSKTDYGYLPDTIGFEDYFFKGGKAYYITLTIENDCGTYTQYDSVTVPSGVNIILERPTAYAQPINGATAVKLHGYISAADSFRWEPATWLDSSTSLTPISSPLDSITYVLIAKNGTCTATDTAHIKYNRHANAGYNDTLCFDSAHSSETLLGFPYDMTLLLGMLNYYDATQFMTYYGNHNTGNSPTYFRYFTHFMHYSSFAASASSCPTDLYNLFTNAVQKELFFKEHWYQTYYTNFTQFSDPSLSSLDYFKSSVLSNTDLKDHLDSLDNWGNIDPCMDNILNAYDDFVANHFNEITTAWSKITDNDTVSLGSWNNFFVAKDSPVKSSKYILSVITASTAEIDEITVLLDTALNPVFTQSLTLDSTVYFTNYTEPNTSTASFIWDFGDGSTNSYDYNAIHTFPAFDSSYLVCLWASNLCGSWSYCDTVYIDSLHQGGSLRTINTANNTIGMNDKQTTTKEQLQKQLQSGLPPIVLTNYPNPFDNNTIVEFEIWQNFTKAELKITNVLGQDIYTQKIDKPIDKIEIDGSLLANGLYYYAIVIDGSVKQTKTMSVIH
ncbi:MAG: T9SS type A sorting domain-containing protein [Bacteroidota bacterium]